jgi:hypothetical protein
MSKESFCSSKKTSGGLGATWSSHGLAGTKAGCL